MYKCGICNKEFNRSDNRNRHERNHQNDPAPAPEPVALISTCQICATSLRTENMESHCKTYHSPCATPILEDFKGIFNPSLNPRVPKKCPQCNLFYLYDQSLRLHMRMQHKMSRRQSEIACGVSNKCLI